MHNKIIEWKDIAGYEGLYRVSNKGRVFSSRKGAVMKKSVHRNEYDRISLCKKGRSRHSSVHRLVAQAFIPNPLNLAQVNHINGIKSDNRALNLEWCTLQQNIAHSMSTGLGVRGVRVGSSILKVNQVKEIKYRLKNGERGRKIAKEFGVNESTVSCIKLRKNWKQVLIHEAQSSLK